MTVSVDVEKQRKKRYYFDLSLKMIDYLNMFTTRTFIKQKRYAFLFMCIGLCFFNAGCQSTTVNGQADGSKLETMQPERDAIDRALAQAASGGDGADPKAGSLFVLERAYKRQPDNINATISYARALRQEGLPQRALLILKPHLQDQPKHVQALTEYAASHLALGRYQDAESAARKAVVEDPEYYRAYHVLGVALDAQGFHKQAETAFRRGLEHWQGDPVPILNNLALSLAAQGYLEDSLSILRRAAASAPNRTEIERNLRIISALHQNVQGHDVEHETRPNNISSDAPELSLKTPPIPQQKPEFN